MSQPKALVFDAYGTLFDVHAVAQQYGAAFSQTWRQKQLEYTWLCALMNRYEDFRQVTEAALRTAARHAAIDLPDQQVSELLHTYMRTPAFEDARAGIQALKHLPLAILSNGTREMIESAVRHNGFEASFREIISVEEVKTYKPSPRVYTLGPERLGFPAAEILFVSSNWWDAEGAKAFGYRVCWCNRAGAPFDGWRFAPDFVVRGLNEIPQLLK